MRLMIDVSVPVRICDNGGWTDVWFGGPGRVFNIAVTPGVEVSIRQVGGAGVVVLDVTSSGDRYPVVPGAARVARHPLVEAAVDELPPPSDVSAEVRVRSAVPVGCGTGTSAAVAVALLGGLAHLRSERCSLTDVAYGAHRLEVEVLGLESGIQDQLSSAFGGINYLEIDSYPKATVRRIPDWDELSDLLTLVFAGRAHDSSRVHRQVIDRLAPRGSGELGRLRDAAVAARDAVLARDLHAFGQAMTANTEGQQALHPDLVGADARRIIQFAARQGAAGWKVNGAGGDGGSVTILSVSRGARHELESRVGKLDPRYRVLPGESSSTGLDVRGSI